MGKLFAISDLHVSHKFNLEAVDAFFDSLPSHASSKIDANSEDDDSVSDVQSSATQKVNDFRQDGLILAGDLSEKLEHLRRVFKLATQKFKTVWWVPGNHELYTLPPARSDMIDHAETWESQEQKDSRLTHTLKGEERYLECCRIARECKVLSPEDDFQRWDYIDVNESEVEVDPQPQTTTKTVDAATEVSSTTSNKSVLVCPIFTLYDYSFRPPEITREAALDWALEQNIQATDEALLHPDPYLTRDSWCADLVNKFSNKLSSAQSHNLPLVIVNHWPLREDLITIPLVPRFTLWCGTKETEDWHVRFNAKVVVTGHLHVRRTDWRDGVRFEEVSLGYPRQWEKAREAGKGIGDLIREILPGNYKTGINTSGPVWRGMG